MNNNNQNVINYNVASKITDTILSAQYNKKNHLGSELLGGTIGVVSVLAMSAFIESDMFFNRDEKRLLAGVVGAGYLGAKIFGKISEKISRDECETAVAPGQVVIIPLVADVQEFIEDHSMTNYNQFLASEYPHILFQNYLSDGDLDISLVGKLTIEDFNDELKYICELLGIGKDNPLWREKIKTINKTDDNYMTLCYALLSAMPSKSENPAIQQIINELTDITHRAVNNKNIVQKIVDNCNII